MLEYEKFIRDPIHGFIGLTEEEVRLISTPAFQRLRRIKQLGNVHLVYPGASHSRFEHSLGALALADRMARHVGLGEDDHKTVRYASLLHDLGHGPLSHVFEQTLNPENDRKSSKVITHEDITVKILNEDPDIEAILGSGLSEVVGVFDDKVQSVNQDMVSSELDSDRMDYLIRDAYHVGVAYGVFDLERILQTIRMASDGRFSYLAVSHKGVDAIESYRLARYAMYKQVYLHHAVVTADLMLNRAIRLSQVDGTLKDNRLTIEDDDFLVHFNSLDDSRLLWLLSQDGNKKSAEIARSLQSRRLLKRVYQADLEKVSDPFLKRQLYKMDPSGIKDLEHNLARKWGCDEDMIIVHQQKFDNKSFLPSHCLYPLGKKPVLVLNELGKLDEFDDYSFLGSSEKPEVKFFVLGPEAVRDEFEKTAAADLRQLLCDS